MPELDLLLEAFAALALGWQGLVAIAIILGGVLVARKAGLVATGNHARLANIILSAVMALLGENPLAEGALMATLSSTLAGLLFELGKHFFTKEEPKAPAKKARAKRVAKK